MSDNETQARDSSMSLRKGIGIYTAFLASFIILVNLSIAITWFPGSVAFFSYLIFGFLLNRIVLRGLIEWHPMYNTLQNVSSAKLSSFFLWPISYAGLFFRLAVNKVL